MDGVLQDTESWESVGSSTQSCSSTVDTVVSEDGGLAAKQRILSDSEDIRGSPTLQEGTSSISDDCQLRVPTIVTEPAGPTGCRRKLDLSPSLRQVKFCGLLRSHVCKTVCVEVGRGQGQ